MLYKHIKIAPGFFGRTGCYTFINIFGLAVALTCVVLSFLYFRHERSFDSFHKNNPHLFGITTTYVDNKTGQIQKGDGTAQVQGVG